MKRFYIFLTAAIIFAACSIEEPQEINSDNKIVRTVSISLVPDAVTRTTFNHEMNGLVWQPEDQVAYFVDDLGTRQLATIVNGSFSVDLDASAHTIRVVYPVSTNTTYNGATYEQYPKNIVPFNQVQKTIVGDETDFNGANLPLVGEAHIDAGTSNTTIDATYSIAAAAVLSFTIDGVAGNNEAFTSFNIYTPDSNGKSLAGRLNYAKVTLPSGTKMKDLQGKKIYVVINPGLYDKIQTSIISADKNYLLSTDITSKGDISGFNNSEIYKYKWNLSSSTTSAISGIMVSLNGGPWQEWTGSKDNNLSMEERVATWVESLQNLGLTNGAILGSNDSPYNIKIVTINSSLSSDHRDAFQTVLKALNSNSRIALDMSFTKFQTTGDMPSYFLQDITVLKEFIFPIGDFASSFDDVSGFFFGCSNLTSVSPIPQCAKELLQFFRGCTSFNQPIVLPEGVEELQSFFSGCDSYNQPITIPSSVTDMSSMFSGCDVYNQPIIIPEKVRNLTNTFWDCKEYNQPVRIPSSVTTITSMFGTCWKMNSEVTFAENSNLLYMSSTFAGCRVFNQPVNIPSKVISLKYAFSGCIKYNQDITIPSSVVDLRGAFAVCNNMQSTVTLNIAAERYPTNLDLGEHVAFAANRIYILNMFGEPETASFTDKVTLRVTNDKLGTQSTNNIWYSNAVSASWTFKDVVGI